jgi:peptide deformylase
MGDPGLRRVAEKVTCFDCDELYAEIDMMIECMHHYQGVGLAAPQIAINKQIIVLQVENNKRYPEADSIPLEVIINPDIIETSTDTELGWEGCLSVPGMRGKVKRAKEISFQCCTVKGDRITRTVSGFHARIIQHEVDHLNGILYPQRIENMADFGFEDSLPDFS